MPRVYTAITMKTRININQEHVIGVVCVAIGVVTLLLTRDFPVGQGNVNLTGPAFFPNIVAIVLLTTGVIQIFVGCVNAADRPAITPAAIRSVLARREAVTVMLTILLIALYVLVMKRIGFFVSTFAVLILMMVRLGAGWIRALIATVVLLAVLYLVFGRLFYVSLPQGVLF